MGSSITRFKEFGFWTRDGLLEVWLFLLVQEIDKIPDPNPWLRELREYWFFQATFGGVGVVDPRLDDYITEDEQLTLVLEFSSQALEWLEGQGAFLSKKMLNAWNLGGEGYFTRDVETHLIVQVGKAFVQLLKGELKTDPSSTFV